MTTLLATNPLKVTGHWADGYTLDQHIQSSEFLGYDGSGNPAFDTVRTEVGESVYQLKYGSRAAGEATRLATTAVAFIKAWKVAVDAVVPMPASKTRAVQPVHLVAKEIAAQLEIELVDDAVVRNKQVPQLKNVEVSERQKILAGAHEVEAQRIAGRNVLLIDDLFQTGATMNVVAGILTSKGGAAKVYALALTRTKRSQ
jgi:predicted amidophosphoribosyltransferase